MNIENRAQLYREVARVLHPGGRFAIFDPVGTDLGPRTELTEEQPMISLHPNPVVLVTGASRGIGREIALAHARRGAQMVLAARTAEALAAVGREVEAIGAEVLAIPTDVASSTAVDALIAGTIGRFGWIDVLVNNAQVRLRPSFLAQCAK
jgi:NADP-dependent 3-hydroxy acid dehydrogenase YdfG